MLYNYYSKFILERFGHYFKRGSGVYFHARVQVLVYYSTKQPWGAPNLKFWLLTFYPIIDILRGWHIIFTGKLFFFYLFFVRKFFFKDFFRYSDFLLFLTILFSILGFFLDFFVYTLLHFFFGFLWFLLFYLDFLIFVIFFFNFGVLFEIFWFFSKDFFFLRYFVIFLKNLLWTF